MKSSIRLLIGVVRGAKLPMLLACTVMLAQPALARHDFTGHHERQKGNREHAFNPTAQIVQETSARVEQNAHRIERLDTDRLVRTAHRFERNTLQNLEGQFVRLNSGVDLDLSSTTQNIVLGGNLFRNADSVSIKSGGVEKTLHAGSQVTAAEYMAVKQVLASGAQAVDVDASGRAVGGRVDLGSITSRDDRMEANSLVNPDGVTVTGDFGKHSTFRLEGDLVNNGTLYAYSSRHGVRSGTISADNINNGDSGLISNVVPEAIARRSTLSDLNLRADDSFTNTGKIESTGSLSVSAGREIRNGHDDAAQSSASIIIAHDDVSLTAPSVINRGLIASDRGNLTIDSSSDSALVIDNRLGTLSAQNAAINLRSDSYSGAFDTQVVGGNYLSQALNMNAGQGEMNLEADQITGMVNQKGLATHLLSATDNLVLGNICLTGDPTFYNTAGSITIAGDIDVNQALTIVASNNIFFSTNGVDIHAGDALQGFPITLIAGANITNTIGGADQTTLGPIPPANGNNGRVLINGGTAGGGIISFSAATGATISTRPSNLAGDQNGGDVLMVAFGGTVAGTGRVAVISGTPQISTGGFGFGNNGNITIIGPGDNGDFVLPFLSTGGGSGSGGDITVTAADPVANNVVYLASGSLQLGGPTIVPSATLAAGGVIRFANTVQASPQSSVTARADQQIKLDPNRLLTAKRVTFETGATGTITVLSSLVASDTMFLTANSMVTDNAGTQTGSAIAQGTGTIVLTSTGDIGTSSAVPFLVSTPNLIVNGTNSVFVRGLSNLDLNKSGSTGTGPFEVSVDGGDLVVSGAIGVNDGNISLSSLTGRVTIGNQTNIAVGTINGNVSIASLTTNKKNAFVTFETNSAVLAGGGPTFGDILISVGALGAQTAGKAPKKNAIIDIQNSGQIFFGKKGFTLNAPDNTIAVDNTEITFNNFISKKNIVLNGNVILLSN